MFDIGFWELAVIGVVALIVIGPDKLPAVARTVGYWFGKGRRFVATVHDDINREINKTEELKRLLEEQSKIKDMHEIIEQTVDETRKSVSVSPQLAQSKVAGSEQKPAASELEGSNQGQHDGRSQAASKPTSSKTYESQSTPPADQVNEQAK